MAGLYWDCWISRSILCRRETMFYGVVMHVFSGVYVYLSTIMLVYPGSLVFLISLGVQGSGFFQPFLLLLG